ncbi:hypothetical protein G352_09072 [Rhodococcus ruber BKS 20-38]|uniref:DUF3618 domain-containing protein n=2 Tax=Rhodococcus TaxID=1827 RepID=M2YUD6_9NOCA|nr:DUF3618 domain-containing protein [Rhodococcus ruber]EME65550.1 hypothetical protein G352_09072 [Rhodococcus ruber BKS 20-38]
MTNTDDPDRIRAEIDRTRRSLSADVDTLADRARPSTIARRKVGGIGGSLSRMRDRVMGTAQDATSQLSDTGRSAVSSATDAARGVPATAQQQAQGNPLAVGLIAFGAGLVAAALVPASRSEQQAAVALKETAEPALQEAAGAAQETAQRLTQPAQEAAHAVAATARDAATTVAEEGADAARGAGRRTRRRTHRPRPALSRPGNVPPSPRAGRSRFGPTCRRREEERDPAVPSPRRP